MSEVGKPRNRSKAEVRVESREGRAVVVKDFSTTARWYRWLVARASLRREARAYARLAGIVGVPQCLGFEGPERLLLTVAPGTSLDRLEPGQVPAQAFDRLDRLIAAIHARGVAIADLHRSNVLSTADGDVSLVDFAIARIARNPHRPGLLVRALFRLDRHAAARIRAYYLALPEPEAEGWFGRLYRLGRWVKRAI